ncbi:glycosyltransferase [Roseococcus suduntuyensis]|uniref:Glycosyltransferase involved in cell wall biosynthesis/GT2 family glycosyltransferase n=1 Tax=Roseococcus suduntuyensis TaxID=455361 RepID=A0A840ACX2_9PROT|nr:glycosyltransferase [Roseococcus suduntuyensis]MBB3898991.1 glycosyltransferase involved in cell wall biosynthesis/GT2 family glycosyltransferase [Roseococcus suduntuyensis]
MRRQRICLLTFDFVGPVRNGGMGTAFLACAEAFRDAGHEVTVLYPAAYTETLPLTHWRAHYAARGIDFVALHLSGQEKEQAYGAWQWIKSRHFDAIHFHEMRGIGHWLVVAKRCGLGLADTALVCQVHSPTLWHLAHSGTFLRHLEELELDWMERSSVQGADVVIAPSRYMLAEVARMGWRLPPRNGVLPNMLPQGFPARPHGDATPHPVEELVFFGRLEARKGLDLFCEAVSRLQEAGTPPARVTFLGKIAQMEGCHALAWLAVATSGWTFPWQVVNDRDVAGAREYLSAPGRLAVIASAMENAPYAVIECLAAGIPLLAPEVGGIPELLAAEDHARLLYPRNPRALAAAMGRALAQGMAPGRAAVTAEGAREAWLEFQGGLAVPPAAPALRRDAPPLVSVCMGAFNRHETLADAIASIEAQTHPAIELILVDDASTSPATLAFLDALRPRFAARGWKLLRNAENSWQGVTRHHAVDASQGEFLLFMDDDNFAWPEEVATFVSAALHSGADVLTCQNQPFHGGGRPPDTRARQPSLWMPIGPAPAVGAFANMMGDANMFMRRDAWDRMGGFTRDRAYFEDWEFLQAASLAGLHVECLPELLYCYRIWDGAQTAAHAADFLYRSHARALRPTLEATPEALRPALRFAVERHLAGMQVRREGFWGRGLPLSGEQALISQFAPNGAEAMLALAEAVAVAGRAETAALLAEQACRLSPGHPEVTGRAAALQSARASTSSTASP